MMLPDDHDMHNYMHNDMHRHGMHHYDVFKGDRYHDRNQTYMSRDRRKYDDHGILKVQLEEMIERSGGSSGLKKVLIAIVNEMKELEVDVRRVQARLDAITA